MEPMESSTDSDDLADVVAKIERCKEQIYLFHRQERAREIRPGKVRKTGKEKKKREQSAASTTKPLRDQERATILPHGSVYSYLYFRAEC